MTRAKAPRVDGVCMTPFGSEVVPTCRTASRRRTDRARVGGTLSPRRREAGRRRACGRRARRATTDTCSSAGRAALHLARQLAMVEAAQHAGHDQQPRSRLTHDEADLALAVDRQDRIADRADAVDRDRRPRPPPTSSEAARRRRRPGQYRGESVPPRAARPRRRSRGRSNGGRRRPETADRGAVPTRSVSSSVRLGRGHSPAPSCRARRSGSTRGCHRSPVTTPLRCTRLVSCGSPRRTCWGAVDCRSSSVAPAPQHSCTQDDQPRRRQARFPVRCLAQRKGGRGSSRSPFPLFGKSDGRSGCFFDLGRAVEGHDVAGRRGVTE